MSNSNASELAVGDPPGYEGQFPSDIAVHVTPGLGLGEIDLECVKEFIDERDPLCFDPTDHWDNERSADRLWS